MYTITYRMGGKTYQRVEWYANDATAALVIPRTLSAVAAGKGVSLAWWRIESGRRTVLEG